MRVLRSPIDQHNSSNGTATLADFLPTTGIQRKNKIPATLLEGLIPGKRKSKVVLSHFVKSLRSDTTVQYKLLDVYYV